MNQEDPQLFQVSVMSAFIKEVKEETSDVASVKLERQSEERKVSSSLAFSKSSWVSIA